MAERDRWQSTEGDDESGPGHSLIASLRSKDSQIRRRAREALTRQGPAALRELVPLMTVPEEDVRCEAVRALADIAHPSTTPDLVAALEDASGEVRLLAAVGLVAIGPAALIPLLHVLHERPDSASLREGAHHVLHQLVDADSKKVLTPVLEALAAGVPLPALRECIQSAIAKLRDLRP